MENYIITISRDFASMGRTIASKMAQMLGIKYYDRDIVEKVSREIGLPVPQVFEEEEKASSYFSRSFPLGNSTTELQDQIFTAQRRVITELAEKESCIIVGRCAEYTLAGHKRMLNIHIYTSYENKYNNCVNYLHLDPKDAKKLIKTVDRAREAYHMRYAGYFPNDPDHNDLLIDSAVLGVEGTASLLVEMIKLKFELSDDTRQEIS